MAERDKWRNKRPNGIKPHTEDTRRTSKRRLRILSQDLGVRDVWRPRTRQDCVDGPRPCPYVGCRHHLYLDVRPRTGTITYVRPDVPPEELRRLPDTCALDVADRGGVTMREVAQLLNVTRATVQLTKKKAIARMRDTPLVRQLMQEFETMGTEPGVRSFWSDL